MSDNVIFLYFLLLPLVSHGPQTPATCVTARVLLSPREINRQIVRLLEEQTPDGASNQPDGELREMDCQARVMNQSQAFTNLLELLREHRKNTAKQIQASTVGVSSVEAREIKLNILKIASEVQDKVITLAFQGYPTLSEYMKQEKSSVSLQWVSEICLDSSKFPEKMALQAKAGKKVELQSYPSIDSMLGSSPLTLEELEKKRHTTDFDIDDILRLFNKDGNPIAPPFSPEKLEGRNLCRVDSTPDLNTPWPNSQSLQYHDIYYYMDENDLGLEKKFSKIRDKILEQDTLCTFVSPKKKKAQPLSKISPVRSSPRRRNSAQHLMTRGRTSSAKTGQLFKQPSLSMTSTRSVSLSQGTPGGNRSMSETTPRSTSRLSLTPVSGPSSHGTPQLMSSRPVSHSTPLMTPPVRASPRKKMLSKSYSSTFVQNSTPPIGPFRDLVTSKPLSSQPRRLPSSSSQHPSAPTGGRLSHHSSLARSLSFDHHVRRSPRKSSQAGMNSSKNPDSQERNQPLPSKPASCSFSNQSLSTVPVDLDESSSQSQAGLDTSKMKRSDRHKLKLKTIIRNVLQEKGVKETDLIYAACCKNLFNVSVVLLRALSSSQNLTEEMKNVVYTQVTQIINLEKRRCGISL